MDLLLASGNLTGILITIAFLFFSAGSSDKEKKEAAYHMLELYGVRTEALLHELFHKTDVLESDIITNHGQKDKKTFDNLAAALLEGDGIKAIQYLPKGIVTYCYPLEGKDGNDYAGVDINVPNHVWKKVGRLTN